MDARSECAFFVVGVEVSFDNRENRGSGVVEEGLVRVPGWDAYPWLRAGFSVRQGGASQVYGANEQNLGWTAEDDRAVVAANRAHFAERLAGTPAATVTVQQVHGSEVRDLEQEPEPWRSAEGKAVMPGDGIISRTPGRLLAVLTADCVPVLVADTQTRAVGAFHAGWRGTLARVAERGVAMMRERYGSRPEDMIAAVGPSIRACCFTVGEEVRTGFEQAFGYAAELISEDPLRMDLAEANRRQLLDFGLAAERIQVLPDCTACARLTDGRRRYFSHRAERGRTGRMLSGIFATDQR